MVLQDLVVEQWLHNNIFLKQVHIDKHKQIRKNM